MVLEYKNITLTPIIATTIKFLNAQKIARRFPVTFGRGV